MAFLSEADIEQGLLELLQSLGWATTSDDLIGPDGKAPERESHDVVVFTSGWPLPWHGSIRTCRWKRAATPSANRPRANCRTCWRRTAASTNC